ncbi:hypothetical protein O6H91_06G052900 [Diphasiastrum complanatum]|uniref:Uncharacterized protein n=1 Tax=Diphasiastrum complanatum TaxID=34168 RepID=A0ACC2DDR0_DIPCM|nr:hypothetical protein O6H91_06G052900 [Diphasiastrum complanatum]
MWLFYTISLSLTLAMVAATLKYFAAPSVPLHVLVIVGYAWFCSLSIIVLVPADIWTTLSNGKKVGIKLFWSWSYWSTFLLTWIIVPILQGYEDAGDFSVSERLKASVQLNVVYYSSVGAIGLLGVVILILLHKLQWGGVMGLAMACSNTFGLVTGAFLLGFGLIEIPRSIWRKADWQYRQKVLTHRIAQVAVKLDDAHQELSTAVVISQAISNQMSRRDPLRHCMDVIDNMVLELVKENPSFKPSAGRMGENDMDYESDEKSMAALRRRLRNAQHTFARYKSEYTGLILEALEIEDVMQNYERGITADWHYISSLRSIRSGSFARYLDQLEWVWRCIIRQQILRVFAVLLGTMTVAVLIAEATLLPSGVDLSLFSVLINSARYREILVQVLAFLPLVYMCACTYFSLFKLGMFTFYYFVPKYTNSVSLLMICSMVSRYAPPICYNFLNLIRLSNQKRQKTSFEELMGSDALPISGEFFFNKIYPLFMVIYTALIASNVLNRVTNYFGSWRRFQFESELEDSDGCDPSGLIILRKERSWLEQGSGIGDHVVPLARNFGNVDMDSETEAMLIQPSEDNTNKNLRHEVRLEEHKISPGPAYKGSAVNFHGNGTEDNQSKDLSSKYASLRDQTKHPSYSPQSEVLPLTIAPKSASIANNSKSLQEKNSGITSTWDSMKSSLQDMKSNFSTRRFAPLRRFEERAITKGPPSSAETLENIFAGLRGRKDLDEFDEDSVDLRLLKSSR